MNAKPITWTRVAAGHYINAETGVDIRQGESGMWFAYSPRPAGAMCEGSRATLAHAKLIGKSAVLAMRTRREADHAEALRITETTAGSPRGARVRRLVVMHGMTVAEAMEIDAETQRLLADGADALIHMWAKSDVLDPFSTCLINLETTPYTFGTTEVAEVTCPACQYILGRRAVAKVTTVKTALDAWAAEQRAGGC